MGEPSARPPLISVTKGRPTAEELAAVVSVLLAVAGQRTASALAGTPSGRAPWSRSHAWSGEASGGNRTPRWSTPVGRCPDGLGGRGPARRAPRAPEIRATPLRTAAVPVRRDCCPVCGGPGGDGWR
ncbi:acyl-CoA carboxylase subunit epsilon [Geodermatophilus sp. URMC 61]|uniref:acyl-CoA carboxylase subunit epsilon n=1 Tax=Geodermatophilus sp. URMC 61 TaxID=3423411 RepID=UPI00406C764C